jgi:hypothetical protein
MGIPFQAIHFAVYEGIKKILLEPIIWRPYLTNSPDLDDAIEDSLSTQLIAGGTAGGVAAAITTPFDVVKTRLQTQGVSSATQYHSISVVGPREFRLSSSFESTGCCLLNPPPTPFLLSHPAASHATNHSRRGRLLVVARPQAPGHVQRASGGGVLGDL